MTPVPQRQRITTNLWTINYETKFAAYLNMLFMLAQVDLEIGNLVLACTFSSFLLQHEIPLHSESIYCLKPDEN